MNTPLYNPQDELLAIFLGNRNIIENYIFFYFSKITSDKPPGRIAYLFSDD